MTILQRTFALLLLAIACTTVDASELSALKDQVSKEKLQTHIRELATSPPTTEGGTRQPRVRKTLEERRVAREYIVGQLTSYGYDVRVESFTRGRETGNNIIARRQGTASNMIFVVGAHYDTVSGSPGADDNASGVAGLLEIARICSNFHFDATIEFVAFDLEEPGLWGSREYVTKAVAAQKHILGAINFDMIGYTHPTQASSQAPTPAKTLIVPGENVDINQGTFIAVVANTGDRPLRSTFPPWRADDYSLQPGAAQKFLSPQLSDRFIAAAQQLGSTTVDSQVRPALPVVAVFVEGTGTGDSRRSDHAHFWDRGIPAAFVTDTAEFRDGYVRYHRPSDNYDSIDFDFLTKVVQASLLTTLDFVNLVQYSYGNSVPLLDSAFYAGGNAGALTASGGFPNNHEDVIAFWGTRTATNKRAVFIVNPYYPESYRRITEFEDAPSGPHPPITWLPDDSGLVAGQNVVRFNLGNQSRAYRPGGHAIAGKGCFTRLPAGQNWYVDVVGGNLLAIPVTVGGFDDADRSAVYVTDFGAERTIVSVRVSPDGTQLAFSSRQSDSTVAVHLISDLAAILQAAPKPSTSISSKAPSSYSDSAIVTVRESKQIADVPFFFPDAPQVSLVETHAQAGKDVVVTDAARKRPPRRIVAAGDQGPAIPILGGSRLLVPNVSSDQPGLSLTTLRVTAPAWGSSGLTLEDGNGSSITIDQGTTVTYPPGAKNEIYLETPIDEIDLGRFPSDVRATSAARTIGPYGATFSKPVTITMRYRDRELERIADGDGFIFGYDRETNRYSRRIPFADIISRNPETNTIVFKTSYASTFVFANGGELE